MDDNNRLALLIDAQGQFFDHISTHLKADRWVLSQVDTELPIVEIIDQQKPALVLIALNLSSMDLSAIISRVIEHAPDLPIIALSKEYEESLISRALDLGVWDFLAFPQYKPNYFSLKIERILELAHLRRENRLLRSQIEKASKLPGPEKGTDLSYLKHVNAEWRVAFDGIRDPIFIHDHEGCIIRVNRAYADRVSLPFDKIIGRPYWEIFPKGDDPLPKCEYALHKGLDTSVDQIFLETGEIFLSRAFASNSSDESQVSYIHILEDVTDQKKTDEALIRTSRLLLTLSTCNQAVVHATDESVLIADTCRIIVETGGYCGTWIGYMEHDKGKTLKPIFSHGISEELLEGMDFSWADNRPPGKAIRTGSAIVVQDVYSDPDMEACCEIAKASGFQSVFAFPLMMAGQTFGALVIYAEDLNAFANDEVNMLCELGEDLAYGIQTLRTRILHSQAEGARAQAAKELESALVQTIQAIAVTVEKRDPYTSGHQQRVAKIATAMALEMGLNQERIEGIRLGALIHDIGKISVPSEILTRPGRLNEIEFVLMKSHTENGFDIIKDVGFPWPVQEMVVQHHERLNGEGYPYGLQGDEIILEARILAVADVVEAMSSHRPYRPSLGISLAIEEITNKRGEFFDNDAVDACRSLVLEKGFQFS